MLPWQRKAFTLLSPHTPEECAARVKAVTLDPYSNFGLVALFSLKSLSGYADATYFCLRKRSFARTPFASELTATLEPVPTGTQLVCETRLNLSARLGLTAFCAILALIGCYIAVGLLRRAITGAPFAEGIIGLLGPLLVVTMGIALGLFFQSDEHLFLEQTLVAQLEARKLDSTASR